MHGLRRMYPGHGNRFGHTRMVLLGNVCQVGACFGLYRDYVSLRARWVHGLRRMKPQAWKSVWAHPIILLRNIGQEEARFGLFGGSVSLSAR